MISLTRIFPECCADTFLVSLLFRQETFPHYNGIGSIGIGDVGKESVGIGDVANAMKRYEGDEFIIGLIDTDKFKRIDPEYIRQFTDVIENKIQEEGLIILKIPDTKRHIIRLHPAFERWTLAAAQTCGVNPDKYGFDTFKKLRKATKKLEVAKNKNIEGLLIEIIEKNPPAIQTLRYWLNKAVTNEK